jgi:predicted metalloprotease with PDZ domain
MSRDRKAVRALRTQLAPFAWVLLATLVLVAAPAAAASRKPNSAPIRLYVDARQAATNLFQAQLVVPARPGEMTLVYPKWIPGEHGPSGPINGMTGLRITANGQTLAWHRDDVDMYAFHCTVPRGVDVIEVGLQFLSPTAGERFSAGASTTEALAVLSWNQVLLYPQGALPHDVRIEPSLELPADWKFATALPIARQDGARVEFETVSLETLVDSPVLAGRNFRIVPLTGGDPPDVRIAIACDSEDGLAMSPELEQNYHHLVTEADALFGARHFRRYTFLLTLSDHVAHFGLEHHESSDNRTLERSLLDPDLTTRMATLLPHEFVHSWNGKYRRPSGLATVDYQQPMRGDMLWVYEGLTQYLGYLLTVRSGLRSTELAHDQLADIAAYLDQRPGRTWRPLRDTAVAAQLVFQAPEAGQEARRAADFYNEGLLVWLEADVRIRQETHGARSLDDFCRRFHGGEGGAPRVVPYTFDDLVAALQATAPGDWASFLDERLDSTSSHAPLGGIESAGWGLEFSDVLPELQEQLERATKSIDLRYSIGVKLDEDGRVIDVVPGRAAAQAGVAAGGKIVAVEGRRFTKKVLREAIRDTRQTRVPLDLLVEDGEFFVTRHLDYHDGERYPTLERDPAKPDLLTPILSPQAGTVATRAGR